MFSLTPISRKERQESISIRSRFFKEGKCSFQITGHEYGQSKKGNEMLTVEMMVYDSSDKIGKMKDYFLQSNQWKLQDLLDAVGMSNAYESGTLDPETLIGKGGEFNLKYKIDRDTGDENKQINYIIQKDLTEETPTFDDNIPF